MSWTDERVELLKKLWKKGLSASQIAEALGDVTRNAVIGKAHRLSLSSRPSPLKKPAEEKKVKPTVKKKKPVTKAKPEKEEEPSTITILSLTDRMCRWPLGHPGDDDFHFCGRMSLPGQPYCAMHAAMAYQAPQPRKDRRRNR
ncbi:MAG: global cell cycle regulator GcrA-like protein [Proteobacteria bacterium]|nr:global cell cycle regulator GcrA-like protein [Pseudomonadota bacterium]